MKLHFHKLNLANLFLPVAVILLIASFIYYGKLNYQLNITALAILIYVVFSLIHHYLDKSLTGETLMEYLLIAILVLIMIAGVTI